MKSSPQQCWFAEAILTERFVEATKSFSPWKSIVLGRTSYSVCHPRKSAFTSDELQKAVVVAGTTDL